MTLISVLVLIGLPALEQMIVRSKLDSFLRQSVTLLHQARSESIKRGATSYILPDDSNTRIRAWVDLDADGSEDGNEEIAELYAPSHIQVESTFRVGGSDVTGAPAVFLPNGTAERLGEFRIQDPRTNIFRIRIAQTGSARFELQKSDCAGGWYAHNPTQPNQSDHRPWTWYQEAKVGCTP
jgi:Tfp pilus assembly protein FimT